MGFEPLFAKIRLSFNYRCDGVNHCRDKSDEAHCENIEYIGKGNQPMSNAKAVSITSLLTALGPIFAGVAILLFILKLVKKDFVRNSRFVISREAILEQIMHDARQRRRGNITTQGNSTDDIGGDTHEDIEIVPVQTMGLPVPIAHGLHRESTSGQTSSSHIDSTHLHEHHEGDRLQGNNSDRNTSSQTGNENQHEKSGIVSLHVSESPISFIPSHVPTEDSPSHMHSTYI